MIFFYWCWEWLRVKERGSDSKDNCEFCVRCKVFFLFFNMKKFCESFCYIENIG